MTNALALINPADFGTMQQMADIATKSTFTKLTKEQALFIMLKGFEIGISPLQALDGIQVIAGKLVIAPQLMLAMINSRGGLEDMVIKSDDQSCSITMTRRGRSPHTETFTMANARSMGLAGKDNWNKQPATMLKWRAVSACARVVFPDVIQGMYTPEEMGAEVNVTDDGDVVVISTPVEEKAPQVQIPATVGAPEPPPPPHDTNKWENGNVTAWVEKHKASGITEVQLRGILGVKSRWSEWQNDIAAADKAVEAWRNVQNAFGSSAPHQSSAQPTTTG